ncbi:MAG: 30S ribosomal protein S1 [Chloroflexota bacterium]
MTDEQMGGTTPEAEAIATVPTASEETVAATAVDEPASLTETVTEQVAEVVAEAAAVEEVAALAAEEVALEVAAEVVDAPASVDAIAVEADAIVVEVDDAPPAGEVFEEVVAPRRSTGPEPTTMEELLAEQDADIRSFKHGDVVEGTVVRIDRDEILVDIGAKSEGVVSNRELFGRHAESQPALAIGDVVLVYVLQPESQEGHAVLSLRRAGLERKWRAMQEQFETGAIIEGPVIDHNKGGLIVDCGIRGFVPISQIVDFPRRPQNDQPRDAAQEIAEKLQPYVGRKLRLKILEVNRKANRLILSEKVALYEERREKRDELFSSLQVGQKVSGTVRSIAPFGVFIDLGGIDGLVHKSELSWNKVNNPEAGYKVGDTVEAEVIDINHERGRISLSIRRLQPDPWHSTVADFKVGDIIEGTVTKLVNFGAFVRVRDGLEGLIHISELSHQRVAHPGDVVREGQTINLKIISLDSERHRLGLSLKQAEEPPARPAPEAVSRPRRSRDDRGYSMADAVQEPEGGIDNTLASAFAQVRQALAANGIADVAVEVAAVAEVAAEDAEETAESAAAAAEVAEDVALDIAVDAALSEEIAVVAVIVAEDAEEVAESAVAAAEVAEDVATDIAVDAALSEEIAAVVEAEAVVAVADATAKESLAEAAVAIAAAADEVAVEAIRDPSVSDVEVDEAIDAALEAEEIAEEVVAEAAAADEVAEELVEEAIVAEVIAEVVDADAADAASEAVVAEEVAEEAAFEAEIAEEVAVEAVVEAVVAEEIAEIAEEVAVEAVVEAVESESAPAKG